MLLELANFLPIIKEFERDEESFKQDVTNLQVWLKTQTHLPEIMDEKRIKFFLLLNKCKVEKTKKRIDMFYTIRSIYPELCANHPNQPSYQESRKAVYFVPLPKLTKNQERVFMHSTRDPSLVENMDPLYVLGTCFHVFEMRIFEDNACNDIYVFDMKHLTTTYLTKFLPLIPKALQIMLTVYSMRVSKMYILNAHPLLGVILNIVKTIVKAKLFERIHVLEEQSMLLDVIPKEILPSNFGGNERSLEDLWNVCLDDFKKYEKYFDEREVQKVNEELRVKLINTTSDVYGNFKKLNVD